MIPGLVISFGMTNRGTVVKVGAEELEILWIEGTLNGGISKFDSADSPIKVGRLKSGKNLEIASGEVSRDHGWFVYNADSESWVYKLDGDRPTNGTWEGVSFYDVEE